MRKAQPIGECSVKIVKVGQALRAVLIYLYGPSAQFPSTSNHREIRHRWIRSKTGNKKRVPFLSKTKFQQEQLTRISSLYTQALVRCGIPFPSFEREKVHVIALLAAQSRKFDSHNYSKPIGDWLEHVGLIIDDTDAEIHCFKREDYGHFRENRETTMVLIQPRSVAEKEIEGLLVELLGALGPLSGI